jgi:Uncharacterised protein family (UPF0093)
MPCGLRARRELSPFARMSRRSFSSLLAPDLKAVGGRNKTKGSGCLSWRGQGARRPFHGVSLERVSLIALKALEAGASVRGRDGFHQCGRRVASLLLVLLLSGVHGFFVRYVKDFAADRNTRIQRFYRFINEVPTVLMIGIVILVIVKPF